MMGLSAKFSGLQTFQSVLLTSEEVSARREPLHRMHDQVKIVKLHAGGLKEVSRKTSCGVVENGRKLCQRNGCRLIERSGRAAAQDHLLDRVLRQFSFRQAMQLNFFARRSGRCKDRWLSSPLSNFLCERKRRRVVHLKHGG